MQHNGNKQHKSEEHTDCAARVEHQGEQSQGEPGGRIRFRDQEQRPVGPLQISNEQIDQKIAPRVRKLALLNVLDPGAIDPMGTSCSALQATVQAWQPIHFRWSMTNAYFVMVGPLLGDMQVYETSPSYFSISKEDAFYLAHLLLTPDASHTISSTRLLQDREEAEVQGAAAPWRSARCPRFSSFPCRRRRQKRTLHQP